MNTPRIPLAQGWRFAGLLLGAVLVAGLQAGNPIYLCESGQPYLWPNGGVVVPFNPDQGTLGPLSNTGAVEVVRTAFSTWEAVPQSTITATNAGPLPVDVNADNFSDYLYATQPDGFSAIVFDTDGQIFDLLFGANSGVLGFAGPEWVDPGSCTILEGVAFLNGAEFGNSTIALDIVVHEFGHYLGLGHSVVNGQVFLGDDAGPTPFNPFGTPALNQVETMYPFYFGTSSGFSTLEKDDVSALTALYPDPAFSDSFGIIQGVIRSVDGFTPLSGVNVIARSLSEPFQDAVSAISGAYALPSSADDPLEGVYILRGLTPGADYVIYTDQITQGEFIREPLSPFPGPEEFYNGTAESNNKTSPDPPDQYFPIPVSAGDVWTDVDIIFNGYLPGVPLPVGDEGYVILPLPFPFQMAGESYNSVVINANGHLTFGTPPPEGDWTVNAQRFLNGPPRIAALWTDLDSTEEGMVTYEQTTNSFTVTYTDVPQYDIGGANTFRITLHQGSSQIEVEYGILTSTKGIAGVTAGAEVTAGVETPVDLNLDTAGLIALGLRPAVYEEFNATNGVDLEAQTLRYTRMRDFNDHWGGWNNALHQARWIELPFSSLPTDHFTEIEPVGQDVDYYRFSLNAGDILVAEVTRATFDSLLGLFQISKGWNYRHNTELLMADDGPGNRSSLVFVAPTTGTYAVAVTATPDVEFRGMGASGGRYVLELKSVTPEPGEIVLNGGFEFGEFLGWTALETGIPSLPWQVTGAGYGGTWTMAPTQPQEGEKVAWNGFDGAGPMEFLLYQDLNIPASGPLAVLRWKDRVQRFFFNPQAQPRAASVQLRDPETDELLETLYSYSTGSGWFGSDSGWQEHEVDVSAYLGSRVRLMFRGEIPEYFTGPGQMEIDAVSLRVGSEDIVSPEPAPSLTILSTKTGEVRVSWTCQSPNWVLQQCSSGRMSGWADCAISPITTGRTRHILVGPTNGCQFYRLRKR